MRTPLCELCRSLANPQRHISEKKNGTQTQTFWSGYFSGGVGVFHVNGWGPKSSVCPSKHRPTKFFWRDIPGFCRDIPGFLPGKFEEKRFVFNSRPIIFARTSVTFTFTRAAKVSRVHWSSGEGSECAQQSEVSKRGWPTEGVGARKPFRGQRFRPLFCTVFSLRLLKGRGTHFWRTSWAPFWGFVCRQPPPANPFSKPLKQGGSRKLSENHRDGFCS